MSQKKVIIDGVKKNRVYIDGFGVIDVEDLDKDLAEEYLKQAKDAGFEKGRIEVILPEEKKEAKSQSKK